MMSDQATPDDHPPEAPPPGAAVAAATPPPLPADAPPPAPPAPTARVAARTEELGPLYQAAISTLTWGFRTGAALLAIGILLALARRESLNRVADPFAEVLPAVLDGEASGVVDLAIIWLMITPVLAVVVVALGFFRLGDRRYGALALLVLAVLGVTITLALGR